MDDIKKSNKVSVYGKLKKAFSSLFKAYADSVQSNSKVKFQPMKKEFGSLKEEILKQQKKLKENIRLTKEELKELVGIAKKAVKDAYEGKVSIEDDLEEEFKDMDFEDEDFEDAGFESLDDPVIVHLPEAKLNMIAMSILFEIARKDVDFANYLKDNEVKITDLISRLKVVKEDPRGENFINHNTYVNLCCEAIEFAASYSVMPITDNKVAMDKERRNDLIEEINYIIKELHRVFTEDTVVTLAVHSILNKVYGIYLDYYTYNNDRSSETKDEKFIGAIDYFVGRKLCKDVDFISKFDIIAFSAAEYNFGMSEVDITAIAIAFRYGLLNLADKHPELQSRLMSFVVRCSEEISNIKGGNK